MRTEDLRRVGKRARPAPTWSDRMMARAPAVACLAIIVFIVAMSTHGVLW